LSDSGTARHANANLRALLFHVAGDAVFQQQKRSERIQNRQCPEGQVSAFAAAN
jgi:hypothetical protein